MVIDPPNLLLSGVAENYAIVGSDLDLIDDIVISGHQIVGYFSTRDKRIGFEFLGDHTKIQDFQTKVKVIVAVDDPSFRKHLWIQHGEYLSGYFSPRAAISPHANLKKNVVVYPHSYVSSQVALGELVKVSVGAQIHHETEVEDFSVIGPRALLLGRVKVGKQAFISSGVTISPGTQIGSNVLIGMGSAVLGDVPSGFKAWGVPARVTGESGIQ